MASIRLPNLDAAEPAISRFELERYIAGELTAERRGEIERALSTDASLKSRHDEILAEQRAFEVELPLARFLADHEKKTTTASTTLLGKIGALFAGRGLAFAGTCAAAAVVLLVVSRPVEPTDPFGAEPGIKGGARVGFFVKTDHNARFGHDGEELTAGDQIQFAVRDDASHNAMVLVGIDGRGAVTVYDAEQIGSQRAKGDNKTRLLKDSVVLDDSRGAERFFVVYGDGPVSAVTATVEDAAKNMASSHTDLSSTAQLPLPSTFVQSLVHIVKE